MVAVGILGQEGEEIKRSEFPMGPWLACTFGQLLKPRPFFETPEHKDLQCGQRVLMALQGTAASGAAAKSTGWGWGGSAALKAIGDEGPLRTSDRDLQALAKQPMQAVIDLGHLVREVPELLPSGKLPFDISEHPAVRHTVAKRLLDRMDKEMARFAEMQKATPAPRLKELMEQELTKLSSGSQEAAQKAEQVGGKSKVFFEDKSNDHLL